MRVKRGRGENRRELGGCGVGLLEGGSSFRPPFRTNVAGGFGFFHGWLYELMKHEDLR